LKKEADSFIQIENFMENCREISISGFEFRSTFNEGSVGLPRDTQDSQRPPNMVTHSLQERLNIKNSLGLAFKQKVAPRSPPKEIQQVYKKQLKT